MENTKLLYWIAMMVLIQYTMIQSTEGCCASRCCSDPARLKRPGCEGCECADNPEPEPWMPMIPIDQQQTRGRAQRIQGKFGEITSALKIECKCRTSTEII